MDDSQPLSILTHRKTYRVRGPRPCSWIPFPSDSPSNGSRDSWPWSIEARQKFSRASTLCSSISTDSSDSSFSSSSSSSSLMHTPGTLVECDGKQYYYHTDRRKPAGPRAPRNSAYFDVRPALAIDTSVAVVPREPSPTSPTQSIEVRSHSSHTPPFIASPTNFPLDWDAIFDMLGCSEPLADDTGSW